MAESNSEKSLGYSGGMKGEKMPGPASRSNSKLDKEGDVKKKDQSQYEKVNNMKKQVGHD